MDRNNIFEEFKQYYLDEIYLAEGTVDEFYEITQFAKYGKSLGISENEIIGIHKKLMGEITEMEIRVKQFLFKQLHDYNVEINNKSEAVHVVEDTVSEVNERWGISVDVLVKIIANLGTSGSVKEKELLEKWQHVLSLTK